MNNLTIDDLIKNVSKYNLEDLDKIYKAYDFAKNMHSDQFRLSGEPYIIHPLNVAYILSEMHADSDTICAGLLHDTIEDTSATKEDITENFNKEIANLVDGVTKISKMNFTNKTDEINSNTRKIITGITSDVRIVIIKLADRLHNMRTLEFKPLEKQKTKAAETMDIFVPISYCIGAYKIKNELEDLCLRYLYPSDYKRIESVKNKVQLEYDDCIKEMLLTINNILNDNKIPNEIKIRTKNIYGIYSKLKNGDKLSDIHDLFALKIMVDEISECYLTLGYVHSKYHPVNDKFKDYISSPKTNMYQSLHTTVFGEDDRLVQTQIRTKKMDKIAENGLMAYWYFENGNVREKMQEELKVKYQFFKPLVEINKMFDNNKEFVDTVKRELFSDNINVYNSKGELITLPRGSTIIDYAFMVSKDDADTMTSATVNENTVPLTYELHDKDRVVLNKNLLSFGSHDDWLKYAKTSNARECIKRLSLKKK